MARTEPGFSVIRGGRLADPAKRRAEPVDVLIEDGVIREVGVGLSSRGPNYFLERSLMMLLRRGTGGVRLTNSLLCLSLSMFASV